MNSSFRRSIASLVCAVMAFQPLAASYAASQQYRIPLAIGEVSSQVELELTPSPIDFEDVAVGQVRTLEARLRNTGTVYAQGVTMTVRYPFSVDGSACRYVPAGGDCPVWVSFAPGASGSVADTMNIKAGDTVLDPVLLGNGVALIADLEISDGGGWNFGPHVLGTSSLPKTLTLSNNGTGSLMLAKVGPLKGSDEYKLVHDCPAELAAGASCSVTVHFEPEVLGQRLGAFRVKSVDGSVRDVWLLGYGILEGQTPELSLGQLSVVPEVNFGGLMLPAQERVQSISLANTGSTPLDLSTLKLAGEGADAFSLRSDCPTQLAPYSACAVHLGFQPIELVSYLASVDFTVAAHEAPVEGEPAVVQPVQPVNIVLKGAGTEVPTELVATPESINFGQTAMHTPVRQSVTLTNHSSEAQTLRITYATNPQNFVVLGGCTAEIAAGASCELELMYQAATPNRSEGELIVVSRETNQTLALPLTGAAPMPEVSVRPASLRFGTTSVEIRSPAKVLTLINDGLAPAQIYDLALQHGQDFELDDSACTGIIPAQGQCEVSVIFKPYASGERIDTLRLQTDDAVQPLINVALSGFGQIGAFSVNPTSANFSSLEIGTMATRTFALNNQGPGAVRLTGAQLSGSGASGYSFEETCSELLAVGESCELTVTFAPTAARGYSATLNLYTGEGLGRQVSLTGWGHAPKVGVLDVFPSSVNMGQVSIYRSASRQVQLKNTGTASLIIEDIGVSGADAARFSPDSNCVGVLEQGSRCVLTLYGAIDALRMYEASLDVRVQGAEVISTAIFAQGVELASDAQLTVVPSFIDLGEVQANVPYAQTVNLKSTGLVAVTVSSVEAPPGVTLLSSCQGDIAPGEECELRLQAKLTAGLNDKVVIRTAQGQHVDVPFKALIAVGLLEVSPASLTFAPVLQGEQSEVQNVFLRNTGNASLRLDNLALMGTHRHHFTITPDCPVSLAPDQSCGVAVRLSPVGAGAFNAALNIATSAGTQAVALTGTGLANAAQQASLDVTPSQVVFPLTEVGQTAAIQEVVLTNTGDALLTLEGVGLLEEGVFQQTNGCAEALAPGQSCAVWLTFTPQAQGLAQSHLIVLSEALSEGMLSVPVQGQGWHAGPEEEILGGLVFEPANVNFGPGLVGETRTRSVTLRNIGQTALSVPDWQVLGKDASAFGVTFSTCPTTLAALESCALDIRFTAAQDRAHDAYLEGVLAPSQAIKLLLQGLGQSVPESDGALLVFSPATADFGSVQVDTIQTFVAQLTNQGGAAAAVPTFTLTGADAGTFGETARTCGATLVAEQSCTITMQFNPERAGPFTASLTGTTAQGWVVRLVLVGQGFLEETPPESRAYALAFTPAAVDFGSLQEGSSRTASVLLKNTGVAVAPLPAFTLQGSGAEVFSTDISACAATLAPSAQCAIRIAFSPTYKALFEAQLIGVTSEAQTVTLPLFGHSREAPAPAPVFEMLLSPTSADFGRGELGVITRAGLTLVNNGPDDALVPGLSLTGSLANAFGVESSSCAATLAAHESCEIDLTFTAQQTGRHVAYLQGLTSRNQVLSATLLGMGPSAEAAVSPASLDFGEQAVGFKSEALTLTLSNTGTVPVSVPTAYFVSGAQAFLVASRCPVVLAAGGTCEIEVFAQPMMAGLLQGVLRVRTVSDAGDVDVPLKVTGVV